MATESPNTLISNTRLKIIDLISEGETALFWPVSGVSGSNPLCSVRFDDVPVLNGDGSPNWNVSGQGFSFQYTSGASGQAPMTGFEKVEALVPLPFNTRVTNPPPNEGYPQSPVAVFNTTQYPDADGVKVTTRFPAVYTVDLANGNTNGFNITWAVDISLNNGPWQQTGLHNLSDFASQAPKCTSPYYNTQLYTLPKTTPTASFYDWKLRVRRVTPTIMSTNTQNDMYLDSVATVSSNTYSYPKSALVGLEISATQFGAVPNRSYEVKGIKVQVPTGYTPTQYNVTDGTITPAVYPGVWNGVFSTTRLWTDNPAWVFYDLVTNRRYGLGNYIRPEWIDKWTLYQIAKYCDEMVDDGNGGLEPRFTCNVAITQQQDAYTLLNNLVSVFQGMLYYANGTIFPVGSEIRDPVFNFSNSNVVNGAFSYSDTPRNTRSTVCIIKWIDPTNNFRVTPERIEDINGIGKYGYIEKQITAFACTSRGQAIRAANWLLTVEQLLTETVSFQTDLEGLYLRPGDVFNVYDNFRNNQQQGGRIVDISQTYVARDTIGLDRNVFLKPGFTYVMSALVPAANYATGQNITGSSQVGLIRNSQIETQVVATPTSTTNSIVLTGGFSSALYRGSVWILNGSGDAVTLFDQATQYKCLVTSEPRNGVTEILGVKYQTGINYLVNNNYSVEVSPPIAGDTVAPQPPTGMVASVVSGVLNDNTFYRYLYLNWHPSPSINASNYAVFGSFNSGALFAIGRPTTTGINYTPDLFGYYDFQVAAFNANGYGSPYTHVIYNEPSTNPLGATAALSGIFISQNYDPYSTAPAPISRYTGYLGTTPTFTWNIASDGVGVETATAQFISGYRVRMNKLDNTVIGPTYIMSGKDNTQLTLEDGILATGASIKSLRSFKVTVETVDDYGNTLTGATLNVTNFQPRAPVGSGFVGYNGGVSYNITPAREADISGVYIWTNASIGFTPTYDNVTYRSTNLAAFAPAPQAGTFYTWYSLVDSYGPSGSILANGDYNTPIYGPISGNANSIFGTAIVDLTNIVTSADAAISGAFGLFTGNITNTINIVSGNDVYTLQAVNGLSGQVTGLPGVVNTALNVRVNTITVSASGSLATDISAIRANTELTGQSLTATVGTVSTALTNSGIALGSRVDTVQANVIGLSGQSNARVDSVTVALATTGGALAAFGQSLQAYTSGASARLTILATAMVTGDDNGFGGAAKATYGFNLDANGKVVSMVATSTSFPNSYGTIVFGGANLQSNTYSPGTAGWAINLDGSVDLNNITGRGTVSSANYVPGVAGWQISSGGNAEFNAGEFRGNIAAVNSGILLGSYPGYSVSPFLSFADYFGQGISLTEFTSDTIPSNGVYNRGTFTIRDVITHSSAKTTGAALTVNGSGFNFAYGSTGETNLYCPSASSRTLKTDGNFTVGHNVNILNGNLISITGSNPHANLTGYAAVVEHLDNTTVRHGLFVGTNWQASENQIFQAASVDATTSTIIPRLTVYGDGSVNIPGALTAGSLVGPIVAAGEFSVDAYGAVGNGTTDDYAAVTGCMGAANAAGGGVVVFTAGKTYKVVGQVTVPGNNIFVKGYGATIKAGSQSDYKKFLFSGLTSGGVEGLTFDGQYTSTPGLDLGAISISNSNFINIVNCTFNEETSGGVYITGTSSRCTVIGNTFYHNFTAIFVDNNGSDNPTFLQIIRNTIRAGLGSPNVALSGAIKISGAGTVSTIAGHVISENIIEDAGQMGIEMQTYLNDCVVSNNVISATEFGISIDTCLRVVVNDNAIKLVTYAGIELANAADCTVEGNSITCYSSGTTRGAAYGIVASNTTPTRNLIIGNRITGSSNEGIHLFNSDHFAVIGNQIYDCGSLIYLQDCHDISVKDNTLDRPVGYHVFVDTNGYDTSNIEISNNIFLGSGANDNIIVYDNGLGRHITGLSITNNNLVDARFGNLSYNKQIPITGLAPYVCSDNKFGTTGYRVAYFAPEQSYDNVTPYLDGACRDGLAFARKAVINVTSDAVNNRWYKIFSYTNGRPINVLFGLSDVNTESIYLVSASPYGSSSVITRLPGANFFSHIVSVIYDNAGGADQHDVWVKVEPFAGTDTIEFWVGDFATAVINNPVPVTAEPSWNANHYISTPQGDNSELDTKAIRTKTCTITDTLSISTLTIDTSLQISPTIYGATNQKLLLYNNSVYRYGLGISNDSAIRVFAPNGGGKVSLGCIDTADQTTYIEVFKATDGGTTTVGQHSCDKLHVGGTSDPSDNNLLVDGTITASSAGNHVFGTTNTITMTAGALTATAAITAASFNTSSLRRLKKKIKPIKNALDTVESLRGVTFHWKDNDKDRNVGFIAEEVSKVLPEAVGKDVDGNLSGVDYGRINAVLVEAVKELSQKVERLEKKLAKKNTKNKKKK